MCSKVDTSVEKLAIRANSLSKRFKLYPTPKERLKDLILDGWGKSQEHQALNNVSFNIRRGEIIGLIGANGAGKSTLLQILCKTLQPSSGDMEINGRVSALLELGAGFNPEYTGIENVKFYCSLQGVSTSRIENILPDIINFADIGEYIYQPLKTYSSGMYVRLAFSAAIHVEPDILIVDEALSVGDVSFQAKCLDKIERLIEAEITILLVTHDIQMVKQYCNRVLYLKKGELVYDGAAEEGTEIYLNESRERTLENKSVEKKQRSADNSVLGFGSKHGAIQSATLSSENHQGQSILVKQGERVFLDICAYVSKEVTQPRLQMTLRDLRGYNIYAFNNVYGGKKLIPDHNNLIRVRFGFDAKLQVGSYAFTIRLDDIGSTHEVKLIDKQVGLVTFSVSAPKKSFEAVVDLNGSCDELDEFQCSLTSDEESE